MNQMLAWKKLLFSALIVFVFFSMFSSIFPVKELRECNQPCYTGDGITNCSCMVAQVEPFPAFYLLRIIAPILVGLLYYQRGKKMNPIALVVPGILMIVALFISYLIFYGLLLPLLHSVSNPPSMAMMWV
jgi:hypothetical protein